MDQPHNLSSGRPGVAGTEPAPQTSSHAQLYRSALGRTGAALALSQRLKQTLDQVFNVQAVESAPSSGAEKIARRNLGAACLLLESLSQHSICALNELGQLLTSETHSGSLPQSCVQISESDNWRTLRQKITKDVSNAGDSVCTAGTEQQLELVAAVPSSFKWREVIYVDDDDDESQSPATESQRSLEVGSPSSLVGSDQPSVATTSSNAVQSLSGGASDTSANQQQQPVSAKRRQSSKIVATAAPASDSTATTRPKKRPTPPSLAHNSSQGSAISKIQAIVTSLEECRGDIEVAIRDDHGLPPALRDLASKMSDLEQQFARNPGHYTLTELKDVFGVVMQQAHRVGEHWAHYFRGRGFALLKKAKRLFSSGKKIAKFWREQLKIEISSSAVNNSTLYYKLCLRFPALPWTNLPFSTVVEEGNRLGADQRFQQLMRELARVVEEEKGVEGDVGTGSDAGGGEEVQEASVGDDSLEETEDEEVVQEEEAEEEVQQQLPPVQESLWLDMLAPFPAIGLDDQNLALPPPQQPQLATIDDGVYVYGSTLPGAGLGLFAARHFAAGNAITGYEGRLISREEALALREAGLDRYVARCGEFAFHSLYVDGVRAERLVEGMAGGSACNHKEGQAANARLVHFDAPNERVEVHAVREIEVGEEIFVDYGRRYWEVQNFRGRRRRRWWWRWRWRSLCCESVGVVE